MEYYKAISGKVGDKIIISRDMLESVTKAKELLLANEFTYPYFFNSQIETELLHQLPIYFTYRGMGCKALLDGVLIDHKEKIIKPFDLKTTGRSVWEFKDSFLQYGYYRQCAFYEQALLSYDSPIKSLLEDGYIVDDFLFIVTETNAKSTRPAIMYSVSKTDREAGLIGGTIGNSTFPGIHQLMDDFAWHTNTNYWEMPRNLYESGGIIKLNLFNE